MSFSPKSGSSIKEFSLKVPKTTEMKHQIIKFNSNLNIDFLKWNRAKMERDINTSDVKTEENDQPKFGAGSEFGREARQEARKKRFGGSKKVSESSPWLLKVGGKKFRGVREGGITENSSYYLFTHKEDGVINAHKLEEWYNFQPIQRYKTLSVEEAEEEFIRRNKVMNHFNLMLQKRLKHDEEEIEDDEKGKQRTKTKDFKTELKISEMDEWVDSDDDSVNSSDEQEIEKKKKEKVTNKEKQKQKKKSKGSEESAFEESDDGDEEGRELDYISDSSDNVSDDDAKISKEMQGVSEDKALNSLLNSDDEDEEKEKEDQNDEQNNDTDEEKIKNDENKLKPVLSVKKKKKDFEKKIKNDSDSESDSSLDSSDIDNEPIRKRQFNLDSTKSNGSNDSSSQSLEPAQKKARLEFSSMSMSDSHNITEDAVRRYLSRKPITTTQLVTKFKNRSNLSSEQLVSIIALLLKKINPEKKMIKNKMFLSLKHA